MNQDSKDKRMDQDRGLNQDGKDERIDQDLIRRSSGISASLDNRRDPAKDKYTKIILLTSNSERSVKNLYGSPP